MSRRSRHPGLAPERTALAWQRTALDFVIVGGLLLRAAGDQGTPVRVTPAAVSLGVAAAVLLRIRLPRRTIGAGTVRAMGAAAVIVGVLAGVLLLVPAH